MFFLSLLRLRPSPEFNKTRLSSIESQPKKVVEVVVVVVVVVIVLVGVFVVGLVVLVALFSNSKVWPKSG